MKNTHKKETIRRYGCELRIYDNGGRSKDRYTMIPPRWTAKYWKTGRFWSCIFSGDDPRGMSGHGDAVPGSHLGKRIHWSDLPDAVQRFARNEWPEFCPPEKLRYYWVNNYYTGETVRIREASHHLAALEYGRRIGRDISQAIGFDVDPILVSGRSADTGRPLAVGYKFQN